MSISHVARIAALCCVFAAVTDASRAQSPDPPTFRLADLLTEVEAANPTLQAARLEAEARARVGAQVGALPAPMVSVTVFPRPMLTAHGAQRTQWQVEQTAPWPGTLGLRERAADLEAGAATHEADALGLDLELQVKQAYYRLYRVQQTEAFVASFIDRLEAFTEAATVRYEVGRGPQGAVLQTLLERESHRAHELELERERQAALQALARLTNRPALALADTVLLEPPPLPADEQALADLALRLRPERRALAALAEQAETEVELARKAFYPDLGVGLTYFDIAAREAPATADGTDALAVMVSAKIPLYRGRLRARLEEARLRQARVEAQREALDTSIRTQIAELAHTARREAETLRLYEGRLLPQAAATVESVLAAYTTGQADYAAVLDAERTRFQVQLGREEALSRYLDATARLERALGGVALSELAAGSVPAFDRPDPRIR